MKNTLRCGVCVSCGRGSRNLSRVCPYCGEMVWCPLWLKALCLATVVMPWFFCLWMAADARFQIREWSSVIAETPRWARCLYAASIGLMLLPANDQKQVLNSTRALWHYHVLAIAISFFGCMPIIWACIYLKMISVPPLAVCLALATLICFCVTFLQRGFSPRLYITVAVLLFAGIMRIHL